MMTDLAPKMIIHLAPGHILIRGKALYPAKGKT